MLSDRTPPARWKRTQRFALSENGLDAESAYRETIIAARSSGGRASFETARAEWATRLRVQPDDGLYLGELRSASKRMADVIQALETCGKSRQDATDAISRLITAGLVVATPLEL